MMSRTPPFYNLSATARHFQDKSEVESFKLPEWVHRPSPRVSGRNTSDWLHKPSRVLFFFPSPLFFFTVHLLESCPGQTTRRNIRSILLLCNTSNQVIAGAKCSNSLNLLLVCIRSWSKSTAAELRLKLFISTRLIVFEDAEQKCCCILRFREWELRVKLSQSLHLRVWWAPLLLIIRLRIHIITMASESLSTNTLLPCVDILWQLSGNNPSTLAGAKGWIALKYAL